MKVLIIKPSKQPMVVEVEKVDLQFLQDSVRDELSGDGWIEAVYDGVGWTSYGNEEAKLLRMEPNAFATLLLAHFGWTGVLAGDFIAGPLVIVGWDPRTDEYSDVPAEVEEYVAHSSVISF